MQKHLRSVHEDRAEVWKAPGFVNGLITMNDRPPKSSKSKSQPDTNGDDIDSDTNNNLNRLLGGNDNKKRKPVPLSASKKRPKKDNPLDLCDDVNTSSPMILPGDEISTPMFNQHRHLPNNSNHSSSSSSTYMLFSDSDNTRAGHLAPHLHPNNHPNMVADTNGFNGAVTQQKQQLLDRFHQTLESLEIVEGDGQLTMTTPNSILGVNGGATTNGGNAHRSHGLLGWDRLTPAHPSAMSSGSLGGNSAATGGDLEGDDDGSYEHFYEDYMVL